MSSPAVKHDLELDVRRTIKQLDVPRWFRDEAEAIAWCEYGVQLVLGGGIRDCRRAAQRRILDGLRYERRRNRVDGAQVEPVDYGGHDRGVDLDRLYRATGGMTARQLRFVAELVKEARGGGDLSVRGVAFSVGYSRAEAYRIIRRMRDAGRTKADAAGARSSLSPVRTLADLQKRLRCRSAHRVDRAG